MSKYWKPTKLRNKYTLSQRRTTFAKAIHNRKTENLIIKAQKWIEQTQILVNFSKFKNFTAVIFTKWNIHGSINYLQINATLRLQ
jgi:hypothetical protein